MRNLPNERPTGKKRQTGGRLLYQDFATTPHPLPRGHHMDLPLILTLKTSKLLLFEDVPQSIKTCVRKE